MLMQHLSQLLSLLASANKGQGLLASRDRQTAAGQKECVLFWKWIVNSPLSPFEGSFLSCAAS